MRSLDFMILSYIFFSRKCVLKVSMFSTLLLLGDNMPSIPPEGSYCVVNGSPKRVHESLDKTHTILCLCISFLEKRSMAFRPHIWILCASSRKTQEWMLRCYGKYSRETNPRSCHTHLSTVCYGFRRRKALGTSQLGRFQEKDEYWFGMGSGDGEHGRQTEFGNRVQE